MFEANLNGRSKTRLIVGDHRLLDVCKEKVYSSVVSIVAIRVAFVLAVLNNLEVYVIDLSILKKLIALFILLALESAGVIVAFCMFSSIRIH